MGIFRDKEIYKYSILEKYKKGVNDCTLVGETENYRIYTLKHQTLSDTYFLRQEKRNPKNVVYLGPAHKHIGVFKNKIFSINRISLTGRAQHPLFCTDVETGERKEMHLLSDKQCIISVPGRLNFYCQDMVESISVVDNSVSIKVTRYKEGVNYEEEATYQIFIRHDGNTFSVEKKF